MNYLIFDIISKDNFKIKYIKKLISKNLFRKKEKKFVIEGIRLCYDALLSKVNILEAYYTNEAFNKYHDKIKKIISLSRKSYTVPIEILKSLSDTENPQGILCVCEELDKPFYLDKINSIGKFIILENIQDPTNLGTMLRTAEAFGLNFIIMSRNCCDFYNPKVLRGSMGAAFRLNIYITENICDVISFLNNQNVKTYAAIIDKTTIPITNINFNNPIAIAIGNEGNGLSAQVISTCSEKITIPMSGKAESLNASMAAGIIMWEMVRGCNLYEL